MADDPERDVLSSLPRTRPARRSARRAPAAVEAATAAGVAGVAGVTGVAGDGDPSPRRLRAEPVPPAGWATPDDEPDSFGPVTAVTTAVRAVGEAAGIAAAVTTQGVRSFLRRLPTP